MRTQYELVKRLKAIYNEFAQWWKYNKDYVVSSILTLPIMD